ncbi:MAG: peptidoglycan-binding protein [Clostridia bacterium]|nr:peptidoglycan-binding protein [Clostridia bacterium]
MKRLMAVLLILAMLIPAAALGEATLRRDMHHPDVITAKGLLNTYGYYTGDLTSDEFDASMETAVRWFQRRNELTVDGVLGPSSWEVLKSTKVVAKNDPEYSGTLKSGSHGEDVKELQRQLRQTYFYAGKIDGIYGAEVLKAVKAFQAAAGINVDGVAGKRTQDLLYNRTARIFTGGHPVRDLYSGMRGWDVYIIQSKLLNLNYALPFVTYGYFDSATVDAVKQFQRDNGLKATGIVDSTLRRYLWPTYIFIEEEIQKAQEGTPDDPYEERILKRGMYGEDVKTAQMSLKAGGYLVGNADGIFGAQTEAAVRRFQKACNLKVDGKIGPKTWARLKELNVTNAEQVVVDIEQTSTGASHRKLRIGCRGSDVTKLQQQLISLSLLPAGADDGKYGQQTAMAVMQFQWNNGLSVDGVAGPQTYSMLNEVLGVQWW